VTRGRGCLQHGAYYYDEGETGHCEGEGLPGVYHDKWDGLLQHEAYDEWEGLPTA
jgi:hypothetical protein